MDFNQLTGNNNSKNNESEIKTVEENINIYVKQRNRKKCITIIHGLSDDKKLLKSYSKILSKKLNCSCSVSKDDDDELVLKLSINDTKSICDFITNILKRNNKIIIHGV